MTKNNMKSALSIVLAIVMAMSMLLVVADYSGTDASISWSLDTSSGTLTVSGSGTMATYAHGSAPWYQHKSSIKNIVVNSGVTLSKGAFYGMENLNKISVPYTGNGSTDTYFGYIFGASNYFQNETYIPRSLETVEITGSSTIASYAFNNASGIKKIVIGDTVSTVSSYAFKDCSSLEKLVFGSGVKTIGANALQRCDALVQAFYNGTSTGWANVTVDSTVFVSPVFLSGGTFTVTVPAKTEYSLGDKLDLTGYKATFANVDVTAVADVVYPDMTTIGTKTVTVYYGTKIGTFTVTVSASGSAGVSGAITWTVSNGVLTVSGNGMMDNYTLETLAPWYAYRDSITSIVVADGVTSVGAYAFYGLDAATSMVLPATVETVDYAAFENCSALTALTINNSAAVVDGTAFRNCNGIISEIDGSKYAKVSGNANYALISANKTATSFAIPATTAVIAEGAFEGSAVTSITIPASVRSIGDRAFASSNGLASVAFGAGVKNIGNYAFLDCGALANVTFNAVPDFVGAGAFAATAVKGTVSNGVTYLGTADNAYAILLKADDASLESCAVNANTKVIASLAFANCTSLEAVQLPEGLLHIGDSAFNSCTALYSVQLPDSLVTIGDAAFKNCSSLTSVDFSDSLELIGNSAFRGAKLLTEIVIGENVENVGYNAFRDCTGLKKVVFNAGSIGYKTFANCSALNETYLADSVLSIGDYAFAGCTSLTSIAIPDTTAAIGYGALYGADAITDIALPFVGEKANGAEASFAYIFGMNAPKSFNTVLIGSAIPTDAFDGVTSIKTLILDKTVDYIEVDSFDVTPSTVYYLGSAAEWSTLDNAEDFANVKFADSEFSLDSHVETYEVGEILSRANFTATLGDVNVTSLLRFVNNPVTSSEPLLPAKLGSVVEKFRAQIIDDIEFTNYSLLLEGSIGIKFYVKLSEFVIANLEEVTATVDYYGVTNEVELVKAENTIDGALYTAKFYVAAKEMDMPITLTVTTPDSTESITRTVKDYVDYVNANTADYTDCINLINEMYNYGQYSKHYFENAAIAPNPDLSDVEVNISNSYTPVKKGSVSGITLEASSLLLESNTTVRHYFKLADGASITDYTFTVNGAKVTPNEKNGRYFVEVDNIIARSLGKLDKTIVSTANETMVITYSPLSYVKLALENRADSDPELALLVKALYRYYVAAADYFVGITDDIETSEDESKPSIW